jgi:hypothetical protein
VPKIELNRLLSAGDRPPLQRFPTELYDEAPTLSRVYLEAAAGTAIALVLAAPSGFMSIGLGIVLAVFWWHSERYSPAARWDGIKKFILSKTPDEEVAANLYVELTRPRNSWRDQKMDVAQLAELLGRRQQYADRGDVACSDFCAVLYSLAADPHLPIEHAWTLYKQFRESEYGEDINTLSRASRIEKAIEYLADSQSEDGSIAA